MLLATQDAASIRQLEQLAAQLASTWKSRDCAGWGALLADDWSVTHIDAQLITKEQALKMCRAAPQVTSSVDQLSIRCYGEAAIVTGRNRAIVTGVAPHTVTLRFTDVFVRRDGRWIVVASHATRLTE